MQIIHTRQPVRPGENAHHASHQVGRAHTAHQRSRFSAVEVLILCLCLVAVVVVGVRMMSISAPTEVSTTQVRVRPTQTLWDLATAHPVPGLTTAQTVEHIKRINSLSTSQLAAGQTIQVPAVGTGHDTVASR